MTVLCCLKDTKHLLGTVIKTTKSQNSLDKSKENMSSSTFSSSSTLDVLSIEENEREDKASRVKIIVMKVASPEEIHIAFENVNKQMSG